jgi:formylglycine-generating enzyme required for sulfatase activity
MMRQNVHHAYVSVHDGMIWIPGGRHMANAWQGEVPRQNTNDAGFERTSLLSALPPNGHGLHDMIGNVWEWTTDWYSPRHAACRRYRPAAASCGADRHIHESCRISMHQARSLCCIALRR